MSVILFTTPRPFEGLYQIIQTNALTSWRLMDTQPGRILLFGDEEHEGHDALRLGRQLDFRIEPVLERSANGVPLISGMFARAREIAGRDGIPCYINADIIILDDLVPVLEEAASFFPDESGRYTKCLMVARRYNVQVLEFLEFWSGWRGELWGKIEEQGSLMAECAIDLFAWSGNVFPNVQPFAVGRYTWDNALTGTALQRGAAVVDITPKVRIVHQSHRIVEWDDPDAQYNRTLIATYCGLKDSTHTLTGDGLVRGWRP